MSKTDLTQGSIKQAIRNLAIPSSIGFLFNTLFNVVDTYFAGQLNVAALAGLTVSFPLFLIMIALASGIGNGATAIAAIALGKKDHVDYLRIAKNALIISLGLAIGLVLLAPFAIPSLLSIAGATGDTYEAALAYMNVIIYGGLFQILNFTFNGLLSAQGDTKPFRNFLIIGFFLNIFLDPLFIFGWFGLPALGTAGVAWATVVVQALGTLYLGYAWMKSTLFNAATFKEVRFNRITAGLLVKQGVPVALNNATISIGIFIIQFFIYRFGNDETLAGYGAAIRIEQVFLIPTIGLNIATVAIVGQNYGAKLFDRIETTIKQALKYALILLSVGLIVIWPFAPLLVSAFNSDPDVIAQGTLYLRIEGLALFSYSFIGIGSSTLQAIKKPYYALLIGILRQLSPLLVFFVLGEVLQLGIQGVWWGIVIINYTAVVLVWLIVSTMLKQLKSPKINMEETSYAK
jgi:putative MATE family efflux protein